MRTLQNQELTILCNPGPFGVRKVVLAIAYPVLHAWRKRRTMATVEWRIATQATVQQ